MKWLLQNLQLPQKNVAIEGKTQTHLVDYYNLDVIISVGYRVKSQNGIIFRKWANKIDLVINFLNN